MLVLGVESSCDETGVALVDETGVIASVVRSQLDHQAYGGVVPELASRAHIRNLVPLTQATLDRANCTLTDVAGLAATSGPGLIGCLLSGVNYVKGMAVALGLPWVGVNHLEGHIFSNLLEDTEIQLPFLTLVVSGGHTELIKVSEPGRYTTLGRTRDDAAGEAFDKVARLLGLGYPGGEHIEKLGEQGDPQRFRYPRAKLGDNLDFSFSGLKTAVLYHLRDMSPEENAENLAHVAASFQEAVVDALVSRTMEAAERLDLKYVAVAGGVASNGRLRTRLMTEAESRGLTLHVPPRQYCTDNGAMIALAGRYYLKQGIQSGFDLSPKPYMQLG